jgi:hypothetical protein
LTKLEQLLQWQGHGRVLVAKLIFQVLFALIILSVLLLPRAYIYEGAPSQAHWRDLRLWAVFLVLVHAVVYWIF